MSLSADRINALASGMVQAVRYLEIGVLAAETLGNVEFEFSVGVDPNFRFRRREFARQHPNTRLFSLTSDEYFSRNYEPFDFIFLDGLHTFDQTFRDLVASVQRIRQGGLVLIDDTLPSDIFSCHRNQKAAVSLRRRWNPASQRPRAWHGDVFRVLPLVYLFLADFDWVTFADGNGQTLLWKSSDYPGLIGTRRELSKRGVEFGAEIIRDGDYLWMMENSGIWGFEDFDNFLSRFLGSGHLPHV